MIQGSLVALITPFDRKGRLDLKTLQKLISWHIDEGTDGIVCCGTTGEALTLSAQERAKVIQVCVETANKRIFVVAGTGTASTKETQILSEKAFQLGADAALVVTPYYNKPTDRGVLSHFQEVAKVGIPLIAYHNPSRAALKLNAEMLLKVGKIPGVIGIKESSHDLDLVDKIRDVPLFAGEDDLTLDMLKRGAIGAISVIGNIIPRIWKQMIVLAKEGRMVEAEEIHKKNTPLCKALFLETNPQCVKYALSQMGKCENILRLPLVPILQENEIKVSEAISDSVEKCLNLL